MQGLAGLARMRSFTAVQPIQISDDPNDSFLDRAVDLIDPELRPVPPQPNCPRSMQIYKTHKLVKNFTWILDEGDTKC